MNPKKAVKYALAHAAIVLSGMLMVLLAIDRVNEAMMFIDNDITKTLLWVGALYPLHPERRPPPRPPEEKEPAKEALKLFANPLTHHPNARRCVR